MFSHQSAAVLLDLPVPRWLEGGDLHICTDSAAPVVRRHGVVGHRGAERRRHLIIAGLRVAAPEETLIDLAPRLSTEQLVQLGDAVLARDPGYTEHIAGAVLRRKGARGIRRLRVAMAAMRIGSASPMETTCRLRIADCGLPAPLLNQHVFDEHGQWVACVDFCWPRQRVIVEYDGDVHDDPAQRKTDAARRRQLVRLGWTVIVVTSRDVLGSEEWLQDLSTVLG